MSERLQIRLPSPSPSPHMISDEIGDVKLPLPKFLKLFTNNNVPVPKAMAVAGKMSVVIPSRRPPAFCPNWYYFRSVTRNITLLRSSASSVKSSLKLQA